ncbi:hypothetical protein [Flavobacterium sp. I3-2]|uniref:hypothetical protein n=1 Tax=Flavobacterium sp. I3-2 TaxID=2748319 RepID=UPI0015B166E8|nr:hypothetical protein [Flavobacterium sp. I3-2]
MNFDELQKQWNNQSTDDIQIKKESLYKTKSIISKVNKNIKNEFFLWVICMLFLVIVPYIDLYKVNGISAFFYYFILFQLLICSISYYRKFYAFRKSIKENDSFKSKENILKMYYELKFAVASYRAACYFLIPQALGLYFILFSDGKSEIYLNKIIKLNNTFLEEPLFILKIVLIGITLLIFVVALSEWMINFYYGKSLKQLKKVIEDFDS